VTKTAARLSCPDCARSFKSQRALSVHARRAHAESAEPVPEASPEPAEPYEVTTAADLWPGDEVRWLDGRRRTVTAVPRHPGVMMAITLDHVLRVETAAVTPIQRVIT
jgi:hypothetical protein